MLHFFGQIHSPLMSVFISGTERIEVEKIFSNIGQIRNNAIKDSLIKQSQYEIQSKISSEVFHSFVDYLSKNILPEIHFDNYYEYVQLNQEFQIVQIQNLLDTVKQKWRQLENQDQMLQGIISTCNQLANDYKQLLNKIDIYHKELVNKDSEIMSLNSQVKDLKSENDQLIAKNEELTSKIEDMQENIDTNKNHIQSIESEIEKQLERINGSQNELNDKSFELNNTINSLKRQFDAFNDDILPQLISKDIQTKKIFLSNFKQFFFNLILKYKYFYKITKIKFNQISIYSIMQFVFII